MNISHNYREENNIITIDFIDHLGDKIGQLAYEIIDNKAIIHDTYLYPEYRKRGIFKTQFLSILNHIKKRNITFIELSVLNEDAKIVWTRLGFTETTPNFFTVKL